MANTSIKAAFERMWQHVVAQLGNKADKNHTHDYAATSHNHDDKYYTESEVDTKLAGKANTTHEHSIGNISGLQSQLADKAALDHLQVIENGGTGATTVESARTNLGFTYGTTEPSGTPSTGEGSVYFKTGGDAIVEAGTSGMWTYQKFASGIVKCWGYNTSSVACTSQSGNLYYGTTELSIPDGLFTSCDGIHITAAGSTGSGYAFFGRYVYYTTYINALFFSTVSATKNISYSVEITGRWK